MLDAEESRVRRSETGYRAQTEGILREWIIGGRFDAGERLNEVDLARELGISRGPLREALQRLAAQGLVTLVSNRGAFVKSFGPKEILDLYELRIALEETAAGLAAERITKAEGRELLEMVDATADEMATSTTAPFPRGHDLHSRIAELSRNEVLAVHLHEVHVHLAVARVLSGSKPDRAREALDEHRTLVQAIASGDRQLARQIMGDHMRHAMENALRVNAVEPSTAS